jgi:hypothetical protein
LKLIVAELKQAGGASPLLLSYCCCCCCLDSTGPSTAQSDICTNDGVFGQDWMQSRVKISAAAPLLLLLLLLLLIWLVGRETCCLSSVLQSCLL